MVSYLMLSLRVSALVQNIKQKPFAKRSNPIFLVQFKTMLYPCIQKMRLLCRAINIINNQVVVLHSSQ